MDKCIICTSSLSCDFRPLKWGDLGMISGLASDLLISDLLPVKLLLLETTRKKTTTTRSRSRSPAPACSKCQTGIARIKGLIREIMVLRDGLKKEFVKLMEMKEEAKQCKENLSPSPQRKRIFKKEESPRSRSRSRSRSGASPGRKRVRNRNRILSSSSEEDSPVVKLVPTDMKTPIKRIVEEQISAEESSEQNLLLIKEKKEISIQEDFTGNNFVDETFADNFHKAVEPEDIECEDFTSDCVDTMEQDFDSLVVGCEVEIGTELDNGRKEELEKIIELPSRISRSRSRSRSSSSSSSGSGSRSSRSRSSSSCSTCRSSSSSSSSSSSNSSVEEDCKTDKKTFPCTFPNCRKSYVFEIHLQKHLKTHTRDPDPIVPRRKLMCEKCGQRFTHLTRHLRKKNDCSLGLTSSQLKRKAYNREDRTFACSQCYWKFTTEELLQSHVKRVHDVSTEKKERKIADLDKNSPMTPCPTCGVMIRKQRMVTHIARVHEKIKNVPCSFPDCGAAFFSKVEKETHEFRVHTPGTENQFICDMCGRGFKLIRDLKKHCDRVHGDDEEMRKFPCPGCDFRFKSAAELRRHLKRRHKELDPTQYC